LNVASTDAEFAMALEAVEQLPERPSNEELLRLYGLYKQATQGDATGGRPGRMDFKGRAKYDAWAALAGTPADDAKRRYVDLVEELKPA
jgi:acyl-CoA-binding protein